MGVKASTQVIVYYSLRSSKPTKPATHPPLSTWSTTEPPYTAGSTKSLYFVYCVIFCDDTFQYSGVSLSSSYEAAKDAYRKAIDVEDRIKTNREGKDLSNA